MNVELRRQEGPHPVVHPHARDAVAVGDELAGRAADKRGVGAVHPDAAEIVEEERSGLAGREEEERQAILPQVPPTAAAAAVVEVRQERTPEYFPQHGLGGDPAGPTVENRIARVETDGVQTRLPI